MLFAFASAYAFANYIDPEQYGAYKYMLSIFGIASIATLLYMSTAITEGVSQNKTGIFKDALMVRFKWGLFGSLFLAITGIYYLSQSNTEFGITFLLLALVVPFHSPLTEWTSYLAGKKKFYLTAKLNIITTITIVSSTIFSLILFQNTYLTLTIFILSHILSHVGVTRWIQNTFGDLFIGIRAPESLQFGKKLSFTKVYGNLTRQLDTIVLWHFTGPAALAYYAFADSLTKPFNLLSKSIVKLAEPVYFNKTTPEIKSGVTKKIFIGIFVLIPFVLLLVITVQFIFEFFFPQYLESIAYVQVLVLLLLLAPTKLLSVGLYTRKNKAPTYIINIVSPTIHLISLFSLVLLYGVWGVVLTRVVDQFWGIAASYYYFRKI